LEENAIGIREVKDSSHVAHITIQVSLVKPEER
jgi:hypothetical protein